MARVSAVIVALLLTAFLSGSAFGATGKSNYQQAHRAIFKVFGRYASQAMRVAYCETGGTYSIWAQNGQYLGLFQMGSSERAHYGHGSNVWAQARAAYRYFAASGYDWSPWSCKP